MLWVPQFHDEKLKLRVHGHQLGRLQRHVAGSPTGTRVQRASLGFLLPCRCLGGLQSCAFDSVYSKWSWKGDQDHGTCAPAEQRWRICGPHVRPPVLAIHPRPAAEFLCGHKFSTFLAAQMLRSLPAVQETHVWSWVGKIPWRRKWQSTPGFFPGESHGQRSLAGYSPWGQKRVRHSLATTTATSTT